MITKLFLLIAFVVLPLVCCYPNPYDCGERVMFFANSIPDKVDSIRVDVFAENGSIYLTNAGVKDAYSLYSFSYDAGQTTIIKVSIHCDKGWQSYREIIAEPETHLGKSITFSFDINDKTRGERVVMEEYLNVCDLGNRPISIISTTSCY